MHHGVVHKIKTASQSLPMKTEEVQSPTVRQNPGGNRRSVKRCTRLYQPGGTTPIKCWPLGVRSRSLSREGRKDRYFQMLPLRFFLRMTTGIVAVPRPIKVGMVECQAAELLILHNDDLNAEQPTRPRLGGVARGVKTKAGNWNRWISPDLLAAKYLM